MALTNKLTAIADAIRGKTGKTEEMTLDQMVTEIEGIQTGGGIKRAEGTFVGDGESSTIELACSFEPDVIFIVKTEVIAVAYNTCNYFGIVKDLFSASGRNNSNATTTITGIGGNVTGLTYSTQLNATYNNGLVAATYSANSCKWAPHQYKYVFIKYT